MSEVKLSLALQGGGAHGAFTWGVLDRLLQEDEIRLDGISGTSAGAMNAVLLAAGWQQGGAAGARVLLSEFWHRLMLPESFDPVGWSRHWPTWWAGLTRHLSPYDLNPFDINPLRELLTELIDFEQLRRESPFRLFIAATEVESGKLRLFREDELSVDHLLASACLPALYQAVAIDGSHYWDGGFAGNPVVYPLLFDCKARDLLLLLLLPPQPSAPPVTAQAIADRVAELGFQTTFMREMRALAVMHRQARRSPWRLGWPERRVRRLRLHLLGPGEGLSQLHRNSRLDVRPDFLLELMHRGQARMECWLAENRSALGRHSSCDIEAEFL
jgi:NTE family protein